VKREENTTNGVSSAIRVKLGGYLVRDDVDMEETVESGGWEAWVDGRSTRRATQNTERSGKHWAGCIGCARRFRNGGIAGEEGREEVKNSEWRTEKSSLEIMLAIGHKWMGGLTYFESQRVLFKEEDCWRSQKATQIK
jgi:hypothetical protein